MCMTVVYIADVPVQQFHAKSGVTAGLETTLSRCKTEFRIIVIALKN